MKNTKEQKIYVIYTITAISSIHTYLIQTDESPFFSWWRRSADDKIDFSPAKKTKTRSAPFPLKYLSLPVPPPQRYSGENIWSSISSAPDECVRKGLQKTLVSLSHSAINPGTGPSYYRIDNSTKLHLLRQSQEAILTLSGMFTFQRHSWLIILLFPFTDTLWE